MAGDDFSADFSGSGELSATLEQLATRTRGLETGAGGFARAMTRAFTQAAVEGRRFDDVLKSLVLRISDLSLRMAMRPLERGIAGGLEQFFGGLSGGLSGAGGGAQAGQGVAALLGDAKPFADGGVIAAPSYFPLPGGRFGLAGEAGPEAILPLARGPDGRLGVAAGGTAPAPAQVTVNIAAPDPAAFRHSEAYLTGIIARAVARGQRGM